MQTLQVLSSERRSGTSKKSGNAYDMVVCQCVLVNDGKPVAAGEFVLPKDHPEVKPGLYTPSLELSKSYDGKIMGVVKGLSPVKA